MPQNSFYNDVNGNGPVANGDRIHAFFLISNTRLRFYCDFRANSKNTALLVCWFNGNKRIHFEMHFYCVT